MVTDLACDHETRPVTLLNDTMILATPGYPGHYPSNTECEWIITPNNNVNVCLLPTMFPDKRS